MRKLLTVLLTALLLLGLTQACAEAALPAVGETVNGFTLEEVRDFPLVNAQALLFTHQKTGARLMYIANDDTNRAFNLVFGTVAQDNTGLPHVFEHATLKGSEKFPAKSLFFNLSFRSYNTYMNAFTSRHLTSYPVASLSEKQLLKLAEFYTDCCLHPSIMTDESIFREEAWRYRLMSPDADLTLEGTVYSEMKGALTLERAAFLNAIRDAYPGSVAGNDSGGIPDDIPDMTWDALKQYHDVYYHPANCTAFLYGEFEDYAAFLQLLDEAFAAYGPAIVAKEDPGYAPLTAPVTASHAYAVEASSPTDHVSTVYYVFVCPDATASEKLALDTMTDLFTAASSPLRLAIRKALPNADFSCSIDYALPSAAILFSAGNVNPDEAEAFRALVDEAIAEVAANGFDPELAESTEAALAIQVKLIREGSSVGVDSILPAVSSEYLATGNPWWYMDYVDALSMLARWNQEGVYADVASRFLKNSVTSALSVTYPEPGAKEAHDQALAEKLAGVKAAMTPAEIDALVASSNESGEAAEDTSAMVAELQAVDVSTLPEEVKEYAVNEENGADGVRFIGVEAGVSGVGQADIFLDASGVAPEDLHYLHLLTGLPEYLNGTTHTHDELARLSERYLFNRSLRLSFLQQGEDGFRICLRLSWIAQDADLAQGYRLMDELAFGLDLDDPQQLLAAVQGIRTNLRSTINNAPYNVIIFRSIGRSLPLYRVYSYANFLEYYAFLEQAEARLQEDPAAFIAELKRVRTQIRNRTNAVAAFSGSAESQAVNRPLAESFLAGLEQREIVPVSYDSVPVPAAREALVIESNVQFNVLTSDMKTLGVPYTADLDAVSSLVSDAYLMPLLRDQYGVYTPMSGFSDDYVYLLTFRDPNITETFAVYEQLPDLLSASVTDRDTLNGYILSSYSIYAMPTGELSGATSALLARLEGRDPLISLQRMKELKSLTPEKVAASAELFRALAEKGMRATAGGAAAINAHADLYDAILNPFNAVDASSVTLKDVSEDDPRYAAVRFVYDEGLMDAPGGVFGADDQASAGELAQAIFLFATGQKADAETSVQTLTAYSLMPACAAGDPLTGAFCQTSLDTFCAAVLVPGITVDTDAAAVMTRGDLAVVLKQFNDTLESLGAGQ